MTLARDQHFDVLPAAGERPLRDQVDIAVLSPRAFRALRPDCPAVVCWGYGDLPLGDEIDAAAAMVHRDTASSEQVLATVGAVATALEEDGDRSSGSSEATVGDESSPPSRTNGHFDKRRRQVLQLLAEGADTKGISQRLHYSERTIKAIIHDIEETLDARTRAEAVAKGIRLGII